MSNHDCVASASNQSESRASYAWSRVIIKLEGIPEKNGNLREAEYPLKVERRTFGHVSFRPEAHRIDYPHGFRPLGLRSWTGTEPTNKLSPEILNSSPELRNTETRQARGSLKSKLILNSLSFLWSEIFDSCRIFFLKKIIISLNILYLILFT